MNYIGQLIGVLAIGVSFLIYIQKSRYRMVFLKLVTDVLWVVHHLSISSFTAAATTGIAILREIVFLPEGKKNKDHTLTLVLFSVLFVAASVFTWKDYFSILPAIASVLATLAFSSDRVKTIRIFALLSSFCMFLYGIHYVSIPTIINEMFVETSIIVSLIKEYRSKE